MNGYIQNADFAAFNRRSNDSRQSGCSGQSVRKFQDGYSRKSEKSRRRVRTFRTGQAGDFGISEPGNPTFPKFSEVNAAALAVLPGLLQMWLPQGRVDGNEYVALNPLRVDRTLGSFRINMRTGLWADFATGETGGDVVSLVAFLQQCSQTQAARELGAYLGVWYDA
jgi:hypothetical protein